MQDGETVKSASMMMLGRYQLLRKIGKGGMGEVWLGEDPRLHRQVAIKTLPVHNQGDSEYLQRFEREARAAAALNHPHILPVHDYGQQVLPDGQTITYIVMPYISGGTLSDRIKALSAGGTPMSTEEATNYLSQAADAIDYAHGQNVIHRDIKPSNILLRGDNWLMLADFGIARIVSDQEHLTQAGVGIGTPEYMAPEQAQGNPVAASDNYSLAVIAYQLFTGKLPFKAETPYAITIQHIMTPPPPPRQFIPDMPHAVEQALLHGLAKEPTERPATAQAFVTELQHALTEEPFEPANVPTVILKNDTASAVDGRRAEQAHAPTTPPPDSIPGGGKLVVAPVGGIPRRQVLIGGGAVLLAALGAGTWAVISKEHQTSPTTGGPKPKPTANPNAPAMTLLAHTRPITSLAWSPSTPNILTSAAQDNQVMLWDVAAIQQGQASQNAPRAKQSLGSATINPLLLAWSADGQSLAIGNAVYVLEPSGTRVDMQMQIYKSDLSGLQPYYNASYMTYLRTGFVSAVSWGPGKYLVAITRPYELAGQTKYYLEFRDPLHPQQGFGTIIQYGFGYSLVPSPDASQLALGVYNGVSVGQPVVAGKNASWKPTPRQFTFDKTQPPAGDVTWSPDGRYIAGITNPQFVPKYIRSQLSVWNVQGGDSTRTLLTLPRSDSILTHVAWSPAPTSTQLAAGSKDGTVYLWNVSTNGTQGNALPVRSLPGPSGAEVTALAWSADGRYLAAGFNDTNNSLLIWKP